MIKQFEEDFDRALTIETKQRVLDNIINTNPTDDATLETISDYKDLLKFLKEEESVIEDKQISIDIDNHKYQLMLCIQTFYPFIANEYYWVRVDNMSEELLEMWKNSMTPQLENYISTIKHIIWVVSDNGVGTRKSKILFTEELSNYFKPRD